MRTNVLLGVMAAAVILTGSWASAAILDVDSNAYTDGNGVTWNGLVEFRNVIWPNFPMYYALAADVEYCVYAPGDFNKSYPGEDPSADQEYVYAYRILNDLYPFPDEYPPYLGEEGWVTSFSVGVVGGPNVASNIGFIDPYGDNQSSDEWISASSAYWEFLNDGTDHQILYMDRSAILLFTSPYEPYENYASLGGSGGDTQMLPSPLPEPSAFVLLGLGTLVMMRRRRRHLA